MDAFAVIVHGFKLLTLSIKNSVLDNMGVLDLPLIMPGLFTTSDKLIFHRLIKYKIISLENGCKFENSSENLSLY